MDDKVIRTRDTLDILYDQLSDDERKHLFNYVKTKANNYRDSGNLELYKEYYSIANYLVSKAQEQLRNNSSDDPDYVLKDKELLGELYYTLNNEQKEELLNYVSEKVYEYESQGDFLNSNAYKDIITNIIDMGANINRMAYSEDVEVAETYWRYFQMPNEINEIYDGITPIMYVLTIKRYDLYDLLLKLGADIQKRDTDGQNLLFYLARYGNYDRFNVMLKHFDVNENDKMGNKAITLSIRNPDNKIFEKLLELSDLNFVNNLGSTLYNKIIESANWEFFRLLTEEELRRYGKIIINDEEILNLIEKEQTKLLKLLGKNGVRFEDMRNYTKAKDNENHKINKIVRKYMIP